MANQFTIAGLKARVAVKENQFVGVDGHRDGFGYLAGADAEKFACRGVAQWGEQRNGILIQHRAHAVTVDAPHCAAVLIVNTVVHPDWACRHHIAAEYSQSRIFQRCIRQSHRQQLL